MGAHKPDEHLPLGVFNYHNQPVGIAFDVEYNPVIGEDTNVAIDLFDFCRRIPTGFFRFCVPSPQRLFSIRMDFPEFNETAT